MKRKGFLVVVFLVLAIFLSGPCTYQGYCSLFTRYSIETHDNPYTSYSLYRSFGFYKDDKTKLSSDYLPNKYLQIEIIKILEEKGYQYKEDFIEADLVIFLFSNNEYSSSTSSIPIYQSNNQYSHYSGSIGGNYFHGNINTFGGGSWNSITVTKNRYYPFVGMSFIDNLSKTYEKVWEGSGITSTRKSNIEKYGGEIVKRILEKFPEMSNIYPKIEEKVEKKGNERINNLINELKNKDNQSEKSIENKTNQATSNTALNSEAKNEEPIKYGEMWLGFSDLVKGTFISGFCAGIDFSSIKFLDIINPKMEEGLFSFEEIETIAGLWSLRKYLASLDNDGSLNFINVITDLYKDPVNTYIPGFKMVEFAYLKLKGENIELLLQEARKIALQKF